MTYSRPLVLTSLTRDFTQASKAQLAAQPVDNLSKNNAFKYLKYSQLITKTHTHTHKRKHIPTFKRVISKFVPEGKSSVNMLVYNISSVPAY